MRRFLALVLAVVVVAGVSTAMADITNGGFETGTTGGWITSGAVSITSAGFDPRTNGALSLVAPGLGIQSVRVGDQDAWGYTGPQYSSIRQSWTVGATDNTDLYFAWAAVGLAPTNGQHGTTETPWFQIVVIRNGVTTLFSQEYYTGDIFVGIQPGWVQGATQSSGLGLDDGGVWYYRPWETFHLNLADYDVDVGDSLQVILTTRDCNPSGHASYAYLDGFGSTPPPLGTPEPASLLLLGVGLASLAGLVRRRA